MSNIYNRKMFRQRNARNALNQSAGVAPIQKFHAGGPVGHTHPHPPAGSVFNVARQQVTQPTFQSIRSPSGRRFMFPPTSPTLSGATDIGLAKKAFKGGLGSLSIPEQMYIGASQGKLRGRDAASGVKNYLGESVLGEVAETAAELGGTAAGGISGLASGLISDSTGSQTSLAGRVGLMEPSDAYLASVGARPADPTGQGLVNLQSPTAMGRPRPAGPPPPPTGSAATPTGVFQGPPKSPYMPDMGKPEDRALVDQQRKAQLITELGGQVSVDPTTGEVTSSTGETIQQLLQKAQTLSDQNRMQQGQIADDGDVLIETKPSDPNDDQPMGDDDQTTTQAQSGTVAETSGEVYDDAILRQAKQANASAGVPKLETATDELDAAMQAGTQSPEDIKAEFLKLLPKYEEDPSVQGLNLAMMGFMIAGGESPHAMKNIAEGMKKGLPAFIKSKEKRKAFEREVDLLASKYTIGRLEEDRKAERQKTTFFATESFELPNGEKVQEGQIFRLNDGAFKVAEQQGITKYLTSEAAYGKQITANASVEKAKLEANNTSINDLYEKSTDVEIGGQKIRVRFPSASGEAAGMVARPSGGQAAWDAFTTGYAENLDQIRFADKGVQSGIDLLDKGEALGTSGLVGKIVDATKAVVPEKYGKALGIDYNTLSDANQFEVVQRSLALQLAPVLLQESGKTISDADRARVAAALGFKVDQQGNILFDNGIVNAFKTEEEARRSLMEVQRVLRRNATKLHAEYGKAAKLFGMQGLPSESKGQAGFVIKEGGEGDEFDLEIIAG